MWLDFEKRDSAYQVDKYLNFASLLFERIILLINVLTLQSSGPLNRVEILFCFMVFLIVFLLN